MHGSIPDMHGDEEFVYPKARALELAKIVDQPVLATPVDLPAPVEALKVAPIVAVKPTGEEVAVNGSGQAPPAEVASKTPAPADPVRHGTAANRQPTAARGIGWTAVTWRLLRSLLSLEAHRLIQDRAGLPG